MKKSKSMKSFKAISEKKKTTVKGGLAFHWNVGGQCRYCYGGDDQDK